MSPPRPHANSNSAPADTAGTGNARITAPRVERVCPEKNNAQPNPSNAQLASAANAFAL